jgi:thiamine transport system permease protein
MSQRAAGFSAAMLPGLVAGAWIVGLIAAPILALVFASSGGRVWEILGDPYIRHVAWFSLWQAALSTGMSLVLAMPMACALARRRDIPGVALLLRMFNLALVAPAMIAILGIATVHGRSGWVNQALGLVDLDQGHYLYGLFGILLAHVFFNMPLATRVFLRAVEGIPPENWRLASQLGMGSWAIFKLMDWPAIRRVMPGAAGAIFMLCFTSFAVVLTLGGGPWATTIEVAIFQALRLDFDIARAVTLAGVQLAICILLSAGFVYLLRDEATTAATERRPYPRCDTDCSATRLIDAAALAIAIAIVIAPLGAVLFAGINGASETVLSDQALWWAAGRSVAVALLAGGISLALGLGLLHGGRVLRAGGGAGRRAMVMEHMGLLPLIMPPLMLASGLFLLLRPFADVLAVGLYLTIAVNALMGLPFVLRILAPAMKRAEEETSRLCLDLGVAGWDRFRLVDWPLVRGAAGLALAIAATLAAGDVGVIALFGTQDTETLPLLLYRRMGAYQMDAAAVTATVLAVLCLGLFWALERTVGGRER